MIAVEPPRELLDRLPARFGAIRAIHPAGASRHTWVLDTEAQRLVAKRMTYERPPAAYRQLLHRVAHIHQIPELVDICTADTCWFALFAWTHGQMLDVITNTIWQDAEAVLMRMATLSVSTSESDLVPLWLNRLRRTRYEPAAKELLEQLFSTRPVGSPVFTHGDFSPQNFCRSDHGLVVLDLEDAGAAPPGLDAGWLLALQRAGALHAFDAEGFTRRISGPVPRANLHWFEGLGLLRLLYRSRTLPMPDELRGLLTWQVTLALRDYSSLTTP